MFLDNINYEKIKKQYLTEQYLIEEYAKGKMASDYISKIRNKCSMMTYVPGFTKQKVQYLENMIETYEDKLSIAKKELRDYKSKSIDEKQKLEKLNKIDTVLSTCIKISVRILSSYLLSIAGAKSAKILLDTFSKIKKVDKIIKTLFTVDGTFHISNIQRTIQSVSDGINEVRYGSRVMKIGGYENEINKCITEMEQLLNVLKNKKTMFERELDKKEKGL